MRYLSWPYTCSLLPVYSPWGTCPGRTPAVCYLCTHHEVLVLAVHLQSVTCVLTMRYLSWPYTCSLLLVYSPWGTCPGRTPAVCYLCTHHEVLVLAVHLQSVTCVLTMRYLSWPYTCSLLPVYSPWGTCPGRTPAVCYTCTHHKVLVLAVHLQSVTHVLTIRYLSWPYTCSLLHVYSP